MATLLDLFNQTLGLLQQPVMSTTDPSPTTEASRLLNANWRAAARQCIEAADWDFAMRRGTFSQFATAPAFGYSYYYNLPTDLARLVYVTQTGLIEDPLQPHEYEIDGNKLASSAANIYARWVSYNALDTPGLWSDTFLRFAAAELGIRCIKLNTGQLELCMKERDKCKKEAIGIDAVQAGVRRRKPGSWSTANKRHSRGGAGGTGLPEQQA